MKIALAQNNYIVGDFEHNKEKILEALNKAKKGGADLVVFAELAITGYPPRDFLDFDDFIRKSYETVTEIAAATDAHTGAIIGMPVFNAQPKGKALKNAAVFLWKGKIDSFFHKTLLPTYDVFDEYRYFEPNREFHLLNFKGKKIAVTICEDIWNVDNQYGYVVSPTDELMNYHPDLMINIAASPFHTEQPVVRKRILKSNVRKYQIPLVYVNHVGAQTELLFDGNSQVINASEEILLELKYFEEDFGIVDLDQTPIAEIPVPEKMALLESALVMGIKNYFTKLGLKKAILGLSGGIDSALTITLAVKALGKENVYGVLMPSAFSSDHSVEDAIQLAKNLGVKSDIIDIQPTVESYDNVLKPYFRNLPFGIAEENIQARTRGVLLMALSNKFGYILLNTSNKSEAAVGYGTLYGDMNGGLSVLGDVYKTEVFALALYINRDEELIPWNIINKPPSAELRPNQKDTDSLPDYDILDGILYQYIELRKGPEEIVKAGFEGALVEKVLGMVNRTEYKRHQAPPILRVSPKAFGMGRRMPIVAKYLT
jgi:NAD+ synthase (glutamine-hydrolysing)